MRRTPAQLAHISHHLSIAAALAALVVVTAAAYAPAWHCGFLWDDERHVTLPALRSLSGLFRIWADVHATQQYYPFLHSAFWIEYRLWGGQPLGYHLVTLLLHVAAAGLVFSILRVLDIPGAYLAAAMFALHPVHVESVAWITEQKNTLSAVCYLGAMLAYLRFDETRGGVRYALALGLFALALASKTVTATLPPAVLIVLWWKRGKLSWRRDVLPLMPFFVMGAAGGLFTAWVERTLLGAEGEPYQLTAIQRGLLAGRAVWFYLGKLLWPANLTFIYPRWTVEPSVWWQWLFPLGAAAVLLALWALRRRWRAPLASGLFFVGTLFPALGLFNVYPFRYSFVADHFQYLASLGVLVPVAATLAWVGARLPRPIGLGLSVLVLGVLGVLTWKQSHMYTNIETLWQTTIERNPGCWMAYNNLGIALQQSGRMAEAVPLYEQALRIKPDHGSAHNNLGAVLVSLGRPQEAVGHFQQALSLMPADAEITNNLGVALYHSGRVQEAIAQYEETLRLNPNYVRAYTNLVIAYTALGRSGEALAAAEKGLELAHSQGNQTQGQYLQAWLLSYRAAQVKEGP